MNLFYQNFKCYPDVQIYLDEISIFAHGPGSSEWTSNIAEALDMCNFGMLAMPGSNKKYMGVPCSNHYRIA